MRGISKGDVRADWNDYWKRLQTHQRSLRKRKTLPDPFAKAICRTVRHSDQDAVTMYLETDSAHVLMRGPGASRCYLELFVLAV